MTTIDGRQVIPAADLPQRSVGRYDALVGVVRSSDSLAAFRVDDLPTSRTAQADIDALKAGQSTSAIYADTLPDLQAVVGTYDGQGAFVLNGSGAGQYRWTGSEWEFLRGDMLATKADQVAVDRIDQELGESGAVDLPYQMDRMGSRAYVGPGPIYPLVVDALDNALMYWDQSKKGFYAEGISGVVERILNDMGLRGFVGAGPIYPIVTGASNEVILGYDAERQALVGLALGEGGGEGWPVLSEVNHFLFYGQSLSVGAAAGVLSTTQPYSNTTFAGGPRAYTGTAFSFLPPKPLVEDAVSPAPDGQTNRGETPCSGAANYAVRLAAEQNGIDPASYPILASAAGKGGARIDELVKGTAWFNTVARPHIQQAVASGNGYSLVIGWVQGEADSSAASTVTRQQYRDALAQLRRDLADEATAAGATVAGTWVITYQCGPVMGSPNPALAQLDLVKSADLFGMATPIYHLPRAADGTHLTAAGYKWMGAYFGRAYKRIAYDKRRPEFLNPISAQVKGSEVRIVFDVPTAPLVLDTVTLAATTDMGFRVVDGSGTVPIASLDVVGSEVVLSLGAAPSGPVTVRYGLDYLGAGLTITSGASGNLRDSTPEKVSIGGIDRPLYHVAPHFMLPAIPFKEI